jgi:DNA-entry nuclease
VKYDIVDGKYLYNRCHLIGYQLTAENANKQNLITGTRYLNVEGMLPFENMVADYVKETGNHVAYRVTPLFDGDNLLASGVVIEGYSIEDKGEGICFNVFAYNIQPGVVIDYANGESHLE